MGTVPDCVPPMVPAGRAAVDGRAFPPSGLDELLDPLDLERPAGRRVDVDLGRVEDDRPLPHLEASRERVDEARQDGPRREPDDAPDRSGSIPRSVWYAVPVPGRNCSSPVTTCVCVPTTTLTRPSRYSPSAFFSEVSQQWKSTRRTGGSCSDDSSSSRSASAIGFSICCMYVRPWRLTTATSVPSSALVHAPAAAWYSLPPVVEWPQHAVVRLEERVDLALVPDVVAAGDDIDAGGQDRLGGRGGQAHAAGHVLAVGGHEVDAALLAEARQQRLDRLAARLADHVADHQDADGALGARRVAVGRVPEARPPDRLVAGDRGASVAAPAGRLPVVDRPSIERPPIGRTTDVGGCLLKESSATETGDPSCRLERDIGREACDASSSLLRRSPQSWLIVAPTAALAGGPGTAASGPRPPVFMLGPAGINDPYFPLDGNGGYALTHYDLAFTLTSQPGRSTAWRRSPRWRRRTCPRSIWI